MASRVSASLLLASDLSASLARSLHDYHEIAHQLVSSPSKLRATRAAVVMARSAPAAGGGGLFDQGVWVTQFERALCLALDLYAAGGWDEDGQGRVGEGWRNITRRRPHLVVAGYQ